MLGEIRNLVERDTAFSLYQSLVMSLFDYCDNAYTLQKLPNTALEVFYSVVAESIL